MIDIFADDVTVDGLRRVRLVSDQPIEAETTLPVVPPLGAAVRSWSDAALGLHYVEATWACREAVALRCAGWKKPKGVVVWKLEPGERVSAALPSAVAVFGETFKFLPTYAWMRKLPNAVELWFEVAGVEFHQAEWAPLGCVVLGDGF